MHPPRGVWVFRWTFSPPPLLLLSHLQSFVSLRYRTFMLGTENAVGGGRGSLAVYAILFLYICSVQSIILFYNILIPNICLNTLIVKNPLSIDENNPFLSLPVSNDCQSTLILNFFIPTKEKYSCLKNHRKKL